MSSLLSATKTNKVTEHKEINLKAVKTHREDERLSDGKKRLSEMLFVFQEMTLQKEWKDIVDGQSRNICILFSEDEDFWEDVRDIDYIIWLEKKNIVNEVYTNEIKEYISNLLVQDPRHEEYQSRYHMLKKYTSLKDILSNPHIQDRTNFDETLSTKPVDDIAWFIETVQEELIEKEEERSGAHKDYRTLMEQEIAYKHTLQTLTKDIKDNTLLAQESTQQRQSLHKKYQQTLTTIELINKKIVTYEKELSALQYVLQKFIHKLDLLHDEKTSKSDKQKIRAWIYKNISGGILQFVEMISYLKRQVSTYKIRTWWLQWIIGQNSKKLEGYRQELITIYPPAQEFFGIVKDSEKEITIQEDERQTIVTNLTNNKQRYENQKKAKDTFLFLYEEARVLKDIAYSKDHSDDKKNIQQIMKHASLNAITKDLYQALIHLLQTAKVLHSKKISLLKDIDRCTMSIETIAQNITDEDSAPDNLLVLLHDIQNILRHKQTDTLDDIVKKCNNYIDNNNGGSLEKTDYQHLSKKIQKFLELHDNYTDNTEELRANNHNIASTVSQIQIDRDMRLEQHNNDFVDLGKCFAAIHKNNKLIADLQRAISIERQTHKLSRNENNLDIRLYKNEISRLEQENKEHDKQIHMSIQETWADYAKNQQELEVIDQKIHSHKTIKTSTEKRIIDLLENPKHTIISQDINTLEGRLSTIKKEIGGINTRAEQQKNIVEDKADQRYQSLIPLKQIIQEIDDNYQHIYKTIGILDRYLPAPGQKMNNTDRSIRRKKEILIEYKDRLLSLAEQIKILLTRSIDANKIFRKNDVLVNMQTGIDSFLDQIGSEIHK